MPQEWMIFSGALRSFETQKALRLLTFHAWKLFTKFHASPKGVECSRKSELLDGHAFVALLKSAAKKLRVS